MSETLIEGLIRNTCLECLGTTKINYQGIDIDFGPEFRWVSMAELVKNKLGIDFERTDLSFDEAKEFAISKGIKVEPHWTSNGYILNALFEEFCEQDLIQPTFVPVSLFVCIFLVKVSTSLIFQYF